MPMLPDGVTRRARLRKLIFALLPTHDDLMTFLLDYFPAVHHRVNGSWTPDAIVNLLFTILHNKEDEILVGLASMHPDAVESEAAKLGLALPAAVQQPPAPRAPVSAVPSAPSAPSAPSGPAPSLDAHALLIGIADYVECKPLRKTLHDVEDVAAVLMNPALGGYAPERVRLLKNQQATRQGILAALDGLARSAGPDSTVLIHFAGHGGRVESGPYRGEYLLPIDTRRGPDLKTSTESAISSATLAAKLAAIPARRLILFLDCCHSGGIGSLRRASFGGDPDEPELREGLSYQGYAALTTGEGSALLAACRDTETAAELHADRNGLFTKHLLDGLRGAAGGDGPGIGIFDLFTYVCRRVTEENPAQHPIFECKRVTENFAVALRMGGRGAGPGRSSDFGGPALPVSPSLSPSPSPGQVLTKAGLYSTLCRLLPSQFELVLFHLGIDVSQLAPRTMPQALRAAELVTYFELPGSGGYPRLGEALRTVLPGC